MIPRPWGHALHANRPNQIIHYDFLFISKIKKGISHLSQYILVLKDDFSHFVELVVCETADHVIVVNALIDWFKRFGIVFQHVSDQGTHFKNRVVDELCSRLHIARHFTTAYTPWANGTVEIVNRHILRILKALCSEFNIGFEENWPTLVPLVNMTINQHIRPRIEYSPLTIMTGLKPTTLLSTIFLPRLDRILEIPTTADRIREMTSNLIVRLDTIHKSVDVKSEKQRESNRRSRSKHRRLQQINFTEGDYVLVASNVKRQPRKTIVNWLGPAQITDVINEHVYRIKFLITDVSEEVHAQRLKFYYDRTLSVTSELLDNVGITASESFIPSRILDIRKNPETGETELQVHWQGFEIHDSTWEPLTNLQEDVPDLVNVFLSSSSDPLAITSLRSF